MSFSISHNSLNLAAALRVGDRNMLLTENSIGAEGAATMN
jgi:hypothetical protein